MKRISKFIPSAIFLCLVPLSLLSAQDKKSEQKIKVIVNDGSGTKVEFDTLITDGHMKDSVRLRNGKVIFFGDQGNSKTFRSNGGSENVVVTLTPDGKERGTDRKVKSITITSSDSVIISADGDGNKVYVINDSKRHEGSSGIHYRVTANGKNEDESDKGQTIYITRDKKGNKEQGKEFSYSYSTNKNESSDEKTKYIIAKDGMVVTVEGNDEAKAKELIKEIKDKLGVKDDEKDKNTTIKVDTKKKEKK